MSKQSLDPRSSANRRSAVRGAAAANAQRLTVSLGSSQNTSRITPSRPLATQRIDDEAQLGQELARLPRSSDTLRGQDVQHTASSLDAELLPVQRKADPSSGHKLRQLSIFPTGAASPRGLPQPLRAGIESLSGLNMGHVRVHHDSPQPARLGALAYTQGSDIHLGPGQEQQLPHEAWHAVQQARQTVLPNRSLGGVPVNQDAQLESEADRLGAQAARGPSADGAPSLATPPPSSSEGVVQGRFTAAAWLEAPRAANASPQVSSGSSQQSSAKPDEHTIDEYTLTSIVIPEARPPTSWGAQQKAHTVSWTLLRHSYEKAARMPLKRFFEEYLIKDWEALGAQPREDAVDGFLEYVDAKTNQKTGLKARIASKQYTDSDWQQLVQQEVADYFTAFQLAPLTIHGTLEKKGNYLSDKPVGHNESGANKFFLSNEVSGYSGNLDKQKAEVLEYAKCYLDQLDWDDHKPITDKALVLLKWEKSLARAYPVMWIHFKNTIETFSDTAISNTAMAAARLGQFDQIDPKKSTSAQDGSSAKSSSDMEVEKKSLIKKDDSGSTDEMEVEKGTSNKTDDSDELETKDEDQESAMENSNTKFVPQLLLSRNAYNDSEKHAAAQITIRALNVSGERPDTKYWINQKSHTIAFLLTLRALEGARGKKLDDFVKNYLLPRWTVIQAQNWSWMYEDNVNLISSDDTKKIRVDNQGKNAENRARLKKIHTSIDNEVKEAKIGGSDQKRSILDWSGWLQERIVNFVEILSSAPLTTHGTKPHGRAEKEPDRWFPNINSITSTKWQEKLSNYVRSRRSEFSSDQLSPQTQKELVSVLAQNLIDVNWKVINNAKDMAILLYEWEHDLASAYPDMWTSYKDTIESFSDNFEVSKSKQTITEIVNGETKPRTITTMKDEMHAIRAGLSSYLKRVYQF